jgi:hypothetical protein
MLFCDEFLRHLSDRGCSPRTPKLYGDAIRSFDHDRGSRRHSETVEIVA